MREEEDMARDELERKVGSKIRDAIFFVGDVAMLALVLESWIVSSRSLLGLQESFMRASRDVCGYIESSEVEA
jgi:hypothetical protein